MLAGPAAWSPQGCGQPSSLAMTVACSRAVPRHHRRVRPTTSSPGMRVVRRPCRIWSWCVTTTTAWSNRPSTACGTNGKSASVTLIGFPSSPHRLDTRRQDSGCATPASRTPSEQRLDPTGPQHPGRPRSLPQLTRFPRTVPEEAREERSHRHEGLPRPLSLNRAPQLRRVLSSRRSDGR